MHQSFEGWMGGGSNDWCIRTMNKYVTTGTQINTSINLSNYTAVNLYSENRVQKIMVYKLSDTSYFSCGTCELTCTCPKDK